MSTSPNPQSTDPATKPLGRPRALDDAKCREFCALISAGCGFEAAARYVGCGVSTLRRESRRNREFAEQLRHAQRDCELGPLMAVHQAAKRHWRAAAWVLERTNSQRYAKISPLTITLDQLREYAYAIVQVIIREVQSEHLRVRVIFTFNQILDHCERELTASRNPFPLPDSVVKLDERPGSPYAEDERRTKEIMEQHKQSMESTPGKSSL